MDFFEYASMAMQFTDSVWVPFLVGGLCFAIVYVFQAIALFTIASHEGLKNKWMAFVPFLNTYYIGVCAQKNRFYNIDTKKIGIAAAVFEFVLCALYVVYLVACFTILDRVQPIETTTWHGTDYYYPLEAVPSNLKWAAWMYNYMYDYILSIFELLFLLVQISLLICFFQTYACRRYVLFTITSILFPIQGILFFVVRNNKGTNYKEFIRAEQAKQYQMYQQYYQQNFNRNPYDNNPYNRPPYDGGSYGGSPNGDNPYGGVHNNGNPPPEDPFGELGGSSSNGSSNGSAGSPFDDFDSN